MLEDYERRKRKDVSLMRSVKDFGMGILILGAGVLFVFREKLHIDILELGPVTDLDIMFGAICFLYGGWRVYRGYKKNYFR